MLMYLNPADYDIHYQIERFEIMYPLYASSPESTVSPPEKTTRGVPRIERHTHPGPVIEQNILTHSSQAIEEKDVSDMIILVPRCCQRTIPDKMKQEV